uniref:TEA domain transcription factor 3 n=1 Tax=Sus scrofa TaxID=9823 RepID=A0A5G2QBE2_PIG
GLGCSLPVATPGCASSLSVFSSLAGRGAAPGVQPHTGSSSEEGARVPGWHQGHELGPGLQGQSPPEHGVHVLGPDCLRQRPTEQVQPTLPSAPGRLLHFLTVLEQPPSPGTAAWTLSGHQALCTASLPCPATPAANTQHCCLRARVAGPHHRLLQAAAPRVFRLHGGAARPRHVQQTPVCAHRPDNPAFSDPPLEAVDVRQIYDKFPEKKGGLKELYEKGPPNAFFLVKFWADLNSTIQEGPGAFYGVSSQYSSAESMTISVSTKVCSFGKQVVEKVETEYARLENGRFVYRIHRSPMCEYMINFIHKLKHLPEKYMMNSVLENFTILQVVTSRDSQETLLVIAFVFEVSTSEHGAQHHVYKLVKD